MTKDIPQALSLTSVYSLRLEPGLVRYNSADLTRFSRACKKEFKYMSINTKSYLNSVVFLMVVNNN